MVQNNFDPSRFSRRGFLAGMGGLALASALPAKPAFAQGDPLPIRYNLSSAKGQNAALQLAKVVEDMLGRDADDPLNWYRYTLIHTLDCPHGNWWFLPWHRAYIGYFEEICRQILGDLTFALPYWDWTVQSEIPSVFFEGALNPANGVAYGYIESFADFKIKFELALEKFWNQELTEGQKAQLALRSLYNGQPLDSLDALWAAIEEIPMFLDSPYAREMRAGCNCFNATTENAVSPGVMEAAMAPTKFTDFASPAACHHSDMSGFGILEGQSHNKVHNMVGGFMQEFMSPVDPIFYMHHSNFERLWLAWTAKQESCGGETIPEDPNTCEQWLNDNSGSSIADCPIYDCDPIGLSEWRSEPFLFYVNESGETLTKTAGDYETIGDFNYTYDDTGSGEPPLCRNTRLEASRAQVFAAVVVDRAMSSSTLATSTMRLPDDVLRSALSGDAIVVAEVTFVPPANTRDVSFNVLINPPEGTQSIGSKSPNFAASFEFFGSHSHSGKPVTFTVPVTKALKNLIQQDQFKLGDALKLSVVPETKGVTVGTLEATVESVRFKVY